MASAAAYNDSLYVMDMQGSVREYSLKDGSSSGSNVINLGGGSSGGGASGDVRLADMPRISGMGNYALAAGGDGSLYSLYDGNLLRRAADGAIETVLEGVAYSIGVPNSSVISVLLPADGSIIVNMNENMQECRLYRYKWDENAAVDPAKTLSVWSLEDNACVRAAISALRKKNPDSYITYEVAAGGNNAVSASDAIKTLNTRLLNGSGPDVIILDGCPVESYAGKGMLLDLSSLVDTGDMYHNLLAPYITDGKMYCFPTQFMMPALMGGMNELSKAQTLDELVNLVVNGKDAADSSPGVSQSPFTSIPMEDRAELYFNDLKELCGVMWISAASAIVKDNTLDTVALKQYLEAVKAISDKYKLIDDLGTSPRIGMSVAFVGGGKAAELPGSLVRYSSQMTKYGAFTVENYMLMQLMMDRGDADMKLFPGLAPGAWAPSTLASVSVDSKVADFAVQLLNAMLSVEVQQINYGTGLPITKTGTAEQIKVLNERRMESGRGTFDFDCDALISGLRAPSVCDTVLEDMIQSSVDKLCSGKTDVDGAVKEIEQNIKNYLAERS
jgi:hypothetical protein